MLVVRLLSIYRHEIVHVILAQIAVQKGRIVVVLIHSYFRLSKAKSLSVSSRCEVLFRQMFVVSENYFFFIINY